MGENKGYGGFGVWILAIFVIAYGWFVNSILSKIFPSLLKTKKEGTATRAYSSFIKGNYSEGPENISMIFEEMCVLNPLKYVGNPKVDLIIEKYRDLIKGRLLDPDGLHTPSLEVDGQENPDYYRYLRNQKRALTKVGVDTGWITEEMARVTSQRSSRSIEAEYIEQLSLRGLPDDLIDVTLTYNRIEGYTPEDWDAFIKATKGALEEGSDYEFVVEFIEDVEDANYYEEIIITNYSILRGEGVPKRISLEYARGAISDSQAAKASHLYQKGYSEEEALIKILEAYKEDVSERDLKEMYRSRI